MSSVNFDDALEILEETCFAIGGFRFCFGSAICGGTLPAALEARPTPEAWNFSMLAPIVASLWAGGMYRLDPCF